MSATRDSFHILHVDDEPDFADTAAAFLEREDDRFTVTTATSASDGLDLLATHEIDCIVSDYDMPGQTGIEFLAAVRDDHPDLPFILFTGKGSEEVASEAISVGVTDYLQKTGGTDQYAVLANCIANLVEKYRAEQARERHHVLIEEATDAILIVEADGTIRYATPSTGSVLGRTPDELVGTSGFELVHPDDQARVTEAFAALVDRRGSHRTADFRYERPDGSWTWVEARGRNLADRSVVDGIVVYIRDITDRKERERVLERERDRFRSVFEESFDPMVIADDDGRYIEVNDRATELFGLPEDELLGRSISEFAPEEFDFQAAWETFQDSNGERGTFPLVRTDGTERIVEYAAMADITPGEHLSILRDITDSKKDEQDLRRYERIVNTMQEAACIYDKEGRFVVVNEYLAAFYGTTPESLVGEPSQLIPRVRSEGSEDRYQELLDGERDELRGEIEADFPDHGYEVLAYRFKPLEIDGTIEGVVCVAHEITERKQREAELERRNERLDEFASLVSHDLQNPLNVAEGRLELAQAECTTEHLDAVERAHERMRLLIEDMLTLAREGTHVTEIEPVVLEEITTRCWETITTAEATLVAETEQTIRADASRLQQLLENLVRNAVEYGGPGVTVTVGE